jgi:putative hydroxymethylpyrimidine transport system substrate-binding protein
MKKYIAAITAAVLSVCLLAACGGDNGNSGNTAQTSAAAEAAVTTEAPAAAEAAQTAETAGPSGSAACELKEFDVILDWYPNAVHTFLYEAQKNGYFEEEGLKVNLISPAESIDGMTFVAAGKAQVGLTYPVDTVTAVVNENMPVRAIGAVVQEELSCMASLAETDITADMTSLKGKTVGHSGPAVEEAIIRTIIKNAGLTEQDVNLLNVGFNLTTSLTTKSTDLVVGTFINDEIVTMKNSGYDVNVWKYQDYGVPQMYGLVMVANKDALEADPEIYKGFLRACAKGFDDMQKDEEQALGVIMSDLNSADNPLDEFQQKESYEILMPLMEQEGKPFLSMSDEVWQATMDWMLESGLISEECELSELYVMPDEEILK